MLIQSKRGVKKEVFPKKKDSLALKKSMTQTCLGGT